MSLKKEQILKVNQNGVDYEVYPETKLHLVKDSNGVSLDKLMDIMTEQVEGNNISTNSLAGELQNIEILGNTIQNSNNLADIKSVGNVREDGLYEISILCTGKNLFNGEIEIGSIDLNTGLNVARTDFVRSVDYIKVNQNSTMVAKVDGYEKRVSGVIFYDCSKKYISSASLSSIATPFNTPPNCCYIKFVCYEERANIVNYQKIQVEYRDKASSYEPYQEYKLNILSPVQLEKVGDIADRIIEKDGVWGVEKNNLKVLGNNITWNKHKSDAKSFVATGVHADSIPNSSVICNKLKNSREGEEYIYRGTGAFAVSVLISVIGGDSIENFNRWITDNKLEIYCQATKSQFIPLPDDQQVKLRTFANQTNIFFLTEVEGTIKADVPKSLGASVSSNTQAIQDLNKDLKKVKKLEKATTVRVSTDKGIVTCKDTIRGRINDVKIVGNTKINLLPNQKARNGNGQNFTIDVKFNEMKNLKPNTKYYVKIFDAENKVQSFWAYSLSTGNTITGTEGEFTSISDLSQANSYFHVYPKAETFSEEDVKKIQVVMVEGGKQDIDMYFEGMKSVGDDINEITISSCNSGKFIIGNIENDKFIDYKTGNIEFTSSWGASDFIEVQEGVKITQFITYSSPAAGIAFYDFNKKYISGVNANKTLGDFKAIIPKGTRYIRCCDKKDEINVYFGNKTELNNICKLDKKKLLYYDTETQTWNKPILREWDSIEESLDNKYYYHKKGSEIILNGNENLQLYTQSLDKYICCFLDISNCKPKSDLICAKLSNIPTIYLESFDQEGIGIHPTLKRFYMKVLKSNLPSPDIDGVKKWLHNNPIPVVYPLEQEVVYECTSLNVDIWDGDSILQIDSIIPPKEFSFNISNNIGNIVKDVQDDVKGLKNWKNKIENATTTLVTTENNIVTVEETSNGYFEDIKIEGKTLVNIAKVSTFSKTLNDPNGTFVGDISNHEFDSFRRISKEKEYTFIIFLHKCPSNATILVNQYGTVKNLTFEPLSYNSNNKVYAFKSVVHPSVEVHDNSYWISLGVEGDQKGAEFEAKIVILEGDYTQNPPNHFESMKSVGDEVNDLWLTSNSGNLFDEALLKTRLEDDGYYHFRTNSNTKCSLFYGFLDKTKKQITSLTPNTGFDLRGVNLESCYILIGINGDKEDDKLQFPIRDFENFNLQGYKGCEFEIVNPNHIKVKNVFIQKDYDNPKYISNKSDKKRLLYYDTENQNWKKPILREWDTIEKHSDGKYYYHKRSIEDILNGSENPWYVDATLSKCCRFYLRDSKFKNGTTICPNFNSIENYSLDEPHIYTNAGQLWLFVPKSELETENVEGLKKWLQSNNITIVYQLAQEEVYECTPIDLITFENKTNYTISSGPIHPKATLKAQNYIGNVIKTLKEKVSYLEDKLYNSNLASLTMALNNLDTQNKLDQILKSLNQK